MYTSDLVPFSAVLLNLWFTNTYSIYTRLGCTAIMTDRVTNTSSADRTPGVGYGPQFIGRMSWDVHLVTERAVGDLRQLRWAWVGLLPLNRSLVVRHIASKYDMGYYAGAPPPSSLPLASPYATIRDAGDRLFRRLLPQHTKSLE